MHDTGVWRRPSTIRILALICIWLGAACASAPPAPTPPPDRDAVSLRMIQLAQAGRIDEARRHLETYLARVPDDGTMLYNLACLDLMLDDTDRALIDLEAALANGYTNFRLMENDHSLSALRDDPRYADLVETYESSLRKTFDGRAITLEEGYPLDAVPLYGSSGATDADVELGFDIDALDMILTVSDPAYRDDALPWNGGSGVLLNLVRPISHDDYESRRYHSLGFGMEDGEPRAYLVGHDGDVRLAPLPLIHPEITRDGDTIVYRASIPWAVFHPYAPPLDQDMGLNVFYVGAGESGQRPVLSLMAEDRLSFEPEPWRRYVPISFWTSDRTRPVLRGRLYDRLAEYGEVNLEFVVWSTIEGPGAFRISLFDATGAPVEAPAPRTYEVHCEEGLNFFNEITGLGDLPVGAYMLVVEFEGPDRLPLDFAETFTRFDEATLDRLNERIYRLRSAESQIPRYRLFELARDLDRRHPQDDPAPLLERYHRIEAMADVCEAGGSTLPESGLALGGFAVDRMTQRSCALYLPKGHSDLASPRLLVVVPPRPGVEMNLAEALGRTLSDRFGMIVAIPQSHGNTGLALDPASRQTALAVDWLRDLFDTGTVSLAGLESGADAALAASLAHPDLFDRVMLDADRLLLEQDRFSAENLELLLAERRNDLPYVLVSRLIADDRLAQIEAAMTARGFSVEIVRVDEDSTDRDWLRDRFDR